VLSFFINEQCWYVSASFEIFFFEEIKMIYINSGDDNFSEVQDVLENSPRKRIV